MTDPRNRDRDRAGADTPAPDHDGDGTRAHDRARDGMRVAPAWVWRADPLRAAACEYPFSERELRQEIEARGFDADDYAASMRAGQRTKADLDTLLSGW